MCDMTTREAERYLAGRVAVELSWRRNPFGNPAARHPEAGLHIITLTADGVPEVPGNVRVHPAASWLLQGAQDTSPGMLGGSPGPNAWLLDTISCLSAAAPVSAVSPARKGAREIV